jgi:hypothetical protein
MRRVLTITLFAIALAAQTKYSGPKPEKKDVPYLVHAGALVQTEIVRSTPKDDAGHTVYSIPGEASLAKTPLALPIFVIDTATIVPTKLQLYQFEPKGGRRELTLSKTQSGGAEPILITVANVSGSLYRIETVNDIENGEYGLTVQGSNQFFCFSVF